MSERYQREIEEILEEAGDLEPARPRFGRRPRFWRLVRAYIGQSLRGNRWSLSPGRVMLIAVSLLLAALVLRGALPGIVGPLAWAGLLLFIVGYGLFFVKPPKIEKIEKRWRGQTLENGGESLWTKFRRRIK